MAEFGSSEAGRKGGTARAKALSKEERSEIGRKGAEVRWKKAGKLRAVPQATHGSPDSPLRIGDIEIPCYVLDDERRVIVQRGMMSALDMSQGTAGRGEGDRLAKFIDTKAIKSFVGNDLADVIKNPIKFTTPTGGVAYGYEATVIADLCDAVLQARKSGTLHHQQEHIAEQCEILVRSFAKVGIIALVDEATGYQYDRARDALEELLEELLSNELRRWVRTFPPAYFKHLCRLRNVPFRADMRLPPYFGHLTNDIIYKRLAPGVLAALQERTPRDEHGNRPNKYFQWLSEGVGHPKLLHHLGLVIGLMKVSDSYDEFKSLLDRAAPIWGETMLLTAAESGDD